MSRLEADDSLTVFNYDNINEVPKSLKAHKGLKTLPDGSVTLTMPKEEVDALQQRIKEGKEPDMDLMDGEEITIVSKKEAKTKETTIPERKIEYKGETYNINEKGEVTREDGTLVPIELGEEIESKGKVVEQTLVNTENKEQQKAETESTKVEAIKAELEQLNKVSLDDIDTPEAYIAHKEKKRTLIEQLEKQRAEDKGKQDVTQKTEKPKTIAEQIVEEEKSKEQGLRTKDQQPTTINEVDKTIKREEAKLADLSQELAAVEAKHGTDSKKATKTREAVEEQQLIVDTLQKHKERTTPTKVTLDENGKPLVTGKASTESEAEKSKAIREAVKDGLYDDVPRVPQEEFEGSQTNEDVHDIIAKRSRNPVEVAEAVAAERQQSGEMQGRDLTTSRDLVLDWFEKGGRITQNVLEQLFGSQGKQGRKDISGEIEARKGLIRKGGMDTVDDIAHDVFVNQENERFDSRQIREAVEEVLSEQTGVKGMRDELYGEDRKSATQIALEEKFTDLTGLPATKANIDAFVEGREVKDERTKDEKSKEQGLKTKEQGLKTKDNEKTKTDTRLQGVEEQNPATGIDRKQEQKASEKTNKSKDGIGRNAGNADDVAFEKWYEDNNGDRIFDDRKEAREVYDGLSEEEKGEIYVPFSASTETQEVSPQELKRATKVLDWMKKRFGAKWFAPLEDFANDVAEVMKGSGARAMAVMQSADKASQFIKDVLDGKIKKGDVTIEISARANKLAEKALGHKINSHSINADEVRHINNEHGVKGKKNTENSIPLRKEDIALLPYIMAAPDRVTKGSTDAKGVESVRYYKTLEDGYVVVVERQGDFSNSDMETITMWAEKTDNKKSHPTYATDARNNRPQSERLNPLTSQVDETSTETPKTTAIISPNDVAKIKKDFVNAINNDAKNDGTRFSTIPTGSAKNNNRKILRVDEYGKNIVWENDNYFISHYKSGGVNQAVLWDKRTDTAVGRINGTLNNKAVPNGYISIDNVNIDKKHRGQGLAQELYQALIDFSDSNVKGIASYIPDRINKNEVPHIWSKLGGITEERGLGDVVVVEQEGKFDVGEMETITMWAEQTNNSRPTNVSDARNNRPLNSTSQPASTSTTETRTVIISPDDIAKIKKDFVNAVNNEAKNEGTRFSAKQRYDRNGNPIGNGEWNKEPIIIPFNDYPQVQSQVNYSQTTESTYVTYTNTENGKSITVRFSGHDNNAVKFGDQLDGYTAKSDEILFRIGLKQRRFIPETRRSVGVSSVKKKNRHLYEEADKTIQEIYALPIGTDISQYKGKLAKGSNLLIGGSVVEEVPVLRSGHFGTTVQSGTFEYFLSTPQGEVYGFVKDGKIHLDPNKLTPQLIAEEFIHLQQQALRLAAEQGDKKAEQILSAWNKATAPLAQAFIKGTHGTKLNSNLIGLFEAMGIDPKDMASELYQRQKEKA